MGGSERNSFDVVAEEIARSFHVNYEKFAPAFGWNTNRASRGIWEEIPAENRTLMVAVVKKLLIDEIIEPGRKVLVVV